MKKPPPPEEKGECAPLWIISFADMISLLMAFFVMLLTMSTAKSGKLCNEGEGIFEKTLYGFRTTMSGLGMPEIFGGKQDLAGSPDSQLNFDSRKVYHRINDANETSDRTIDAREERIRRIFTELKDKTKTFRSPMAGKHPNFVITPITFGQGQPVLDQSAKQFLNLFASNLQESVAPGQMNLYVVGFAAQEPGAKQQWLISARRAQAVADFLHEKLPAGSGAIYCWGAGAGGDWAVAEESASKKTHILIAVLSDNN